MKEKEKAIVTIGIPAYKATDHICDALASIQIQTMRKVIHVIIATDLPGEDYSFTKDRFPDLNITILPCEENTGVGLARQRALDACETDWITFMDADDVLISPLGIEDLYRGCVAADNIIECQGAFYEELMEPQDGVRIMVRNEISQPWVFAKMYSVKFIRQHNIRFSDLRAMEDGEFNWKITLTLGNCDNQYIKKIDKPIYFWRTGSDHSITRIKMKGSDIPQYNFDLGQWGTIEAAIRAVKFAREQNPDNPMINDFILDVMLSCYFTLVECMEKAPVFAGQNAWNAQRFYHEMYKDIEWDIPDQKIKDAFSAKSISRGQSLLGTIPTITWYDFMDPIRNEKYNGIEGFKKIRADLPQDVIENDKKTKVLE